jgi:hypothetical protein
MCLWLHNRTMSELGCGYAPPIVCARGTAKQSSIHMSVHKLISLIKLRLSSIIQGKRLISRPRRLEKGSSWCLGSSDSRQARSRWTLPARRLQPFHLCIISTHAIAALLGTRWDCTPNSKTTRRVVEIAAAQRRKAEGRGRDWLGRCGCN